MSQSKEIIETQITIIGAGIAGCYAALALAPYFEVIIIDKLRDPKDKIGECLPGVARRILSDLKILDMLENSDGSSKIPHLKHMATESLWGSNSLSISDSLKNPDGFGWILDRKYFENSLRKELLQNDKLKLMTPYGLYSATYSDEGWLLKIQNSQTTKEPKHLTIKSNYVIDASGRQSIFAKKLGFHKLRMDKLIACNAIFPETTQNNITTVVASDYGWWYSSPLPHNRRLVSLHSDRDLLSNKMTKDPSLLLKLLKTVPEIHKYIKDSETKLDYKGTRAANSEILQKSAGLAWAAIGDAAISFDPLSSQGIYNALVTSMQLANLLKEEIFLKKCEFHEVAIHDEYEKQIRQIWDQYLFHKNEYYNNELRWRNSPFWFRRHINKGEKVIFFKTQP